jgi:hypothetical protein
VACAEPKTPLASLAPSIEAAVASRPTWKTKVGAKRLDDIDEGGGRERHLLRETIGKPTYDKLISKPKTAAIVEQWEAASTKTKPAATKALSIAIAKTADKPELAKRIEREIGDAFDEPAPRHAQSYAPPDPLPRLCKP